MAIVLASVAALLAPAAADARLAPDAPAARTTASLEQAILAEINGFRHANGLKALRIAPQLRRAAVVHAQEMGSAGFFGHDSLDGSSASTRIRRFYSAGGYSRWSVGETLLWRSPDVSASEALQMWLDSPPHRQVLRSAFREIGLAVVHLASGPGVYGGREVSIVVADFGSRG
jgi:uncharacterized protein YkwD